MSERSKKYTCFSCGHSIRWAADAPDPICADCNEMMECAMEESPGPESTREGSFWECTSCRSIQQILHEFEPQCLQCMDVDSEEKWPRCGDGGRWAYTEHDGLAYSQVPLGLIVDNSISVEVHDFECYRCKTKYSTTQEVWDNFTCPKCFPYGADGGYFSPDETKVLDYVKAGLREGREVYGPLKLSEDPREMLSTC
jgi:hypothetical protein